VVGINQSNSCPTHLFIEKTMDDNDETAIVRADVLDRMSSNGNIDKMLGPANQKFRHEPVSISGISFVSSLWLLFILAVSGALIVSFVFPSWVTVSSVRINRDMVVQDVYIGLFWYCRDDSNGTQQCERYGTDASDPLAPTSLSDVQAFFAACVLYGAGCVLLLISFIFGLFAYLKPRIGGVSMFLVTFFIQLIAGTCCTEWHHIKLIFLLYSGTADNRIADIPHWF